MHNTLGDFKKMAELITEQFSGGGPLCIGLYNPTGGGLPTTDMRSFCDEFGRNPDGTFSLFHVIETLGEMLPKINPNLLWLHIVHSEGALIANEVFEACEKRRVRGKGNATNCMKNQLLVATYGAVRPVRKSYAFSALNTYSSQDIVLRIARKRFSIDFKDLPRNEYVEVEDREHNKYMIRLIDSLLPPPPPHPYVSEDVLNVDSPIYFSPMALKALTLPEEREDHTFTKPSYASALKNDVEKLKEGYQIYDCKTNR